MAYINSKGEKIEESNFNPLCTIERIEDHKNGNNFWIYYHPEGKKDQDGSKKIKKFINFQKLLNKDKVVSSAIEEAVELKDQDYDAAAMKGQQFNMISKIDPAEPQRSFENDKGETITYDNYVPWEIFGVGEDPQRKDEEYTDLCKAHGYVPKGRKGNNDAESSKPVDPNFGVDPLEEDDSGLPF